MLQSRLELGPATRRHLWPSYGPNRTHRLQTEGSNKRGGFIYRVTPFLQIQTLVSEPDPVLGMQ